MTTEAMPVPVKKSPRSHEKFVTYVNFIASCLTGNPHVTSPEPSVASLVAKAAALAQAHTKAMGRGPGLVADRNDKRRDLEDDLNTLVHHVSTVIKAQGADPAAARTIILSTGLSVRKRSSFSKPPFAVKYGGVSGEVVLVARAMAETTVYYWELSEDQASWRTIPETLQAKVTISGLTPGQTYYFRFRTKTRSGGMGDYSDVVKLIVH